MEVDAELIKKLFAIANLDVPDEITPDSLEECVFNIKNSLDVKSVTQEKSEEESENIKQEVLNDRELRGFLTMPEDGMGNILVVDDIGIVTYQIKVTFTKLGYNVTTAKDIFSAINSFIKNKFIFIIMDLFVSTEQEGYTLLTESKKIITQHNLPTKIIVITASNKTENKIKCMNGGADYFVKKDVGWQDKLVEIVESNISKIKK